MTRLPVRVLLCSTVIPPDPSGQAIVLGRLFRSIDPADYRVVAFGPVSGARRMEALPLPAVTYRIAASWRPGTHSRNRLLDQARAQQQFLMESITRGRRLAAIARRERCGALLVASGGIPDLAAGLVASRATGLPLIVHMFDEWRHQVAIDRRLARLAALMQRLVLARARAVLVPNDALKDTLERRYGCRCVTIPNPPAASPSALGTSDWPASPDELAVVYTGKVYAAQADAMARLLNALESPRLPATRLHIYTDQPSAQLLVGGIRGRVVVHGHRSEVEIREIQARADVLFLPLAFGSPYPEIIRTSAPTKLAEYLASGRPILVHAPRGSLLAQFARKESVAEVVDLPGPELLVDALLRLIAEPARRAEMVARAASVAARDYAPAATTLRFARTLQAVLGESR